MMNDVGLKMTALCHRDVWCVKETETQLKKLFRNFMKKLEKHFSARKPNFLNEGELATFGNANISKMGKLCIK